jgi:hypothetical protein
MSIMQSLFSTLSKTFTFVASATSTTSTISIPAISSVGDFAVLFDSATGILIPTTVVPSGWSSISNVSEVELGPLKCIRSIVSYKSLVSGDPGSSITGMYAGIFDATDRKIIMVFRPNFSVQNTSILSVNGATNSNSQTITITESQPPILAFAHWASNGTISSRGVSGITMNEVSNTTGQYASYKIFNSNETTSDATISMSDNGSVQSLQSFYVQFT